MPNHKAKACCNGHDYTPENTYLHGGKQHCRTCKRIAGARANAKLDAETLRNRRKAWRDKNPEYPQAYLASHREKINTRRRKRHAEVPELSRAHNRDYWQGNGWVSSLQHKYGLTQERFDLMVESQNGKCAICGRVGNVGGKRLAVDHCHTTDIVRGLLCNPCNMLLGNAQDSVELLTSAISYLLRHSEDQQQEAPAS